jgi:methionyl-tRNA formyltransferase
VGGVRVALFGQAAFGRDALVALREAGEQIVGVSAPVGAPGERPDALVAAAEEAGVPVLDTRSLREPAPIDAFRAWQPELLVFAFVTEIVRPEVLAVPQHGAIQYHPSLLPRHRGRSAINWAIAAGETSTGLTVFWVDEGIDTGPVLLRREVPIGPDDTVGSLYFTQLYPQGIEALVEAVGLVREGRAPREPQDEALATYEPPMGRTHSAIDWSRPAGLLYDQLRSCDPQPGARALLGEDEIRLFDGALREAPHRKRPGTVLQTTDEGGAELAVIGGVLTVGRAQRDGAPKHPAAELLSPGDRLGRAAG